jgi:rRNA processing protein Krr1/Pno1|tara:strand:+ start:302 stop:1843 length:1542 start_codon:yes stop_codon:yes gene_type:complete
MNAAAAAPHNYDDRYADPGLESAQPPLPAGGPPPPAQREYEDRRAPPSIQARDDDYDVYVMNTEGNNGLVVGPRGANVKRLEQMSGCKINCNQDKTTVEISGPPRGIQMAIEAINDLIDSRLETAAQGGGGGPPHQRDSRDLRHTIGGGGGGGSGMKRGRYDDDYPPLDDHRAGPNSSGKRQRGNDGGIVHSTLIDKLREETVRRNIPPYEPIQTDFIFQLQPDDRGKVSYEEVVGDNLGLIIGKKFNTYKELQRIMDCSFKIWDEKKAVSYHGFPEKVAEAVLLVQELCYLGHATKRAREEDGETLPVKQQNQHQQQQRQQHNKDESYEPKEGEIVETMEAPGKIGLVLGRKGANITRIRRVSNCNVHADNDTQSIRIVGTPENVKKCVALINETIERGNKNRAEKQQGGAPAAAEEDQPIADADADAQTGQHGETIEAAVVPEAEQQPVELADADAENAAAPSPTTEQQKGESEVDFSKMTVAQLKVELQKRNLPTDGLKAALIQRLEEAA